MLEVANNYLILMMSTTCEIELVIVTYGELCVVVLSKNHYIARDCAGGLESLYHLCSVVGTKRTNGYDELAQTL